jgi:multidrug efflux pump subunit AcrA (membrane-fusion protein)
MVLLFFISRFMRILRLPRICKARKKFSLFLLLLCFIGLCYYFFWYKKSDDTVNLSGQEQAISVQKQDIVSTLSVTGKSKIKNEQSLNFNTPGKVTAVYVEVGQEVQKDTLLAQIDQKEVLAAIQEKQIELEQSQLKYTNLLSDRELEAQKMQQDIETKKRELEKKQSERLLLDGEQKIAENNKNIWLENLQIDINKMKKELQNNIKALERVPSEKLLEIQNLETSLKQSQKDYDIAYAQLDAEKQKQVNNYALNFQTEYLALTNYSRWLSEVFRSYNQVLDIDEDYEVKNEVLQTYFSVKDIGYVSQAKQYYKSSKSRFEEFETLLKNNTTPDTPLELMKLLEIQKLLSQDLYNLALAISAGVDSSLFSEWNADEWSFRAVQSTAQSQISEQSSKLIDIQKKYDELKLLANPEDENTKKVLALQSKKIDLEKMQNALQKAQEELENISWTQGGEIQKLKNTLTLKENELALTEIEKQKLIQTQTFDREAADTGIESAKLELQDAQKNLDEYLSPSNESFTLANNAVRQAQIALENEQKNIEKYELRAPFSGTVSSLNIFVWDNLIDQDKTKNISLQNPYIVEVQVQVDQVDLVKISRWQETQVFFDAYQEKVFSWSIIDVSGTPNTDSGLSKYEVKILVDTENREEKIYSGMSARAEIVLKKLNQIIAVPSLSLELDAETGESFVTKIMTDGTRKKQTVETGFTDGILTEIISWLQEWDTIIEINYAQNPLPEESFWNPYNTPF